MIIYNILFIALCVLQYFFGTKWFIFLNVITILLFNLRFSGIVIPTKLFGLVDGFIIFTIIVVLFFVIKYYKVNDLVGIGLLIIKDLIYHLNVKTKVYIKVERKKSNEG